MAQPVAATRLTDRKKAAIVAAAVSLFQQQGFDGTSMDQIATLAEVSKRTVYNHFSSKEQLFQAIVAELLERSGRSHRYDYSPTRPLDEQLLAIGHSVAAVITHEDFMKLSRVVVSRFLQSPQLAAETIREPPIIGAGLVAWLKAAHQDRRLAVDAPEAAATQFTSLIKAFAFWPQLIGSQKPLTKQKLQHVVQSTVTMFLAHYQIEAGRR